MLIGNTTITPMTKQEQLTLSCDSDNLSERDEAEADVSSYVVKFYSLGSGLLRVGYVNYCL